MLLFPLQTFLLRSLALLERLRTSHSKFFWQRQCVVEILIKIGGKKIVWYTMLGKTVKRSKPARKIWAENENHTLSSNSYWRGLFKMPSTLDGQGNQHRTTVLVETHDTAITTSPFSSEHVSLIHFYLVPAFSYTNTWKKSQNLSPHLHWGNCSISKTINTSARELSTKGVSRNAFREPAVHNLTPAWETIPSVWEQSHSSQVPSLRKFMGKGKNRLFSYFHELIIQSQNF